MLGEMLLDNPGQPTLVPPVSLDKAVRELTAVKPTCQNNALNPSWTVDNVWKHDIDTAWVNYSASDPINYLPLAPLTDVHDDLLGDNRRRYGVFRTHLDSIIICMLELFLNAGALGQPIAEPDNENRGNGVLEITIFISPQRLQTFELRQARSWVTGAGHTATAPMFNGPPRHVCSSTANVGQRAGETGRADEKSENTCRCGWLEARTPP
ncbi:hypothetical protein EGW08_019661 [Elysia chlorotica]|uniref:Uncharacterized protein n=1 Tax=Elysia chlorotica TaxID=188477 RepID=A0A433STG4_ELYCH|nr:hypothetical protein EGW08_019661 [Elysia chlorotica]